MRKHRKKSNPYVLFWGPVRELPVNPNSVTPTPTPNPLPIPTPTPDPTPGDNGGDHGDDYDDRYSQDTDSFDVFINRLWRLPRLMLMGGVFIVLALPFFNSGIFIQWTHSLATVPNPVWYLITMIISSLVASKALRDWSCGGYPPISNLGTNIPLVSSLVAKLPSMLVKRPVTTPASDDTAKLGRFANTKRQPTAETMIKNMPLDTSRIDAWKAKQ